ncbi:MAG: hypothetical protein NVS3B3_03550 [Aquirhabdus sp.]
MDIFAAFMDLPQASDGSDFSAIKLQSERQDYLAKAIDGSPIFLLHDPDSIEFSPTIELTKISIQFNSCCRVKTEKGIFEDKFAVVSCTPTIPELYELFVGCFAAMVEQLPCKASTLDIRNCIQKLLDLFRIISRPSSREINGLWAELFVISMCKDISQALTAWHHVQFPSAIICITKRREF